MKWIKKAGILFAFIFTLMNVIAAFHAYKFTHFSTTQTEKTKKPSQLTLLGKLEAVFFGVSIPTPKLYKYPTSYSTITLKDEFETTIWNCPIDSSKGTVILFHGYSGCKSDLISRSEIFHLFGYSTVLVDFTGSGDSKFIQTTIGFHEAKQVKSVYDFVSEADKNIVLFGSSMGAVSITKAINDYQITPTALLLECPFATMLSTTKSRFEIMNIPPFPMAHLLMFWGGIENEFDAFSHNPINYAKSINAPTLLMYGDRDPKVSLEETESLFQNIPSKKELKIFKGLGHENYILKQEFEWTKSVSKFLNQHPLLQSNI